VLSSTLGFKLVSHANRSPTGQPEPFSLTIFSTKWCNRHDWPQPWHHEIPRCRQSRTDSVILLTHPGWHQRFTLVVISSCIPCL